MTTPFSPNQRDLAKAWLHIFLFIFIFFFFIKLSVTQSERKIFPARDFVNHPPPNSSQLRDETHIINGPRSLSKVLSLNSFDSSTYQWRANVLAAKRNRVTCTAGGPRTCSDPGERVRVLTRANRTHTDTVHHANSRGANTTESSCTGPRVRAGEVFSRRERAGTLVEREEGEEEVNKWSRLYVVPRFRASSIR